MTTPFMIIHILSTKTFHMEPQNMVKMPRCEKGLAKLGFGFLGPALKFRGATKHLCL